MDTNTKVHLLVVAKDIEVLKEAALYAGDTVLLAFEYNSPSKEFFLVTAGMNTDQVDIIAALSVNVLLLTQDYVKDFAHDIECKLATAIPLDDIA